MAKGEKSDCFLNMKMALVAFLLLLLSSDSSALFASQNRKSSIPPDLADKDFLKQLESSQSPIINGNWVTFIYRGKAKSIELMSDLTGWGQPGLKLKQVPGKEIRYLSVKVADDARIEYKYLIQGNWRLDSLNPNRVDNGIGGLNNFFVMPEYRPSEWAQLHDDIQHGRIEDLSTEIRGGRRPIRVYLPPGYDASTEVYPTLYLNDGIEYLERARVNVIVDNLIAARQLRPIIIVFVAPLDRMKEYWLNADYVRFLIAEIVAKVDTKFRTIKNAGFRAIGGASLGGLTAAYAAMRRSDIFGKVLGQSSAFWVNSMRMLHDIGNLPRHSITWYLEVGHYEPLLDLNRHVKAVLLAKGYKISYREVYAGHNWTHWRDAIADGLVYLFPPLIS
jgi:enterochelin esterase-like enzyme